MYGGYVEAHGGGNGAGIGGGENGGVAFILIYLGFVILAGLPDK